MAEVVLNEIGRRSHVKVGDRVLASLPDSYNVLVTEVKKKNSRSSEEGGLVAHTYKKKPVCFFCQKNGSSKPKVTISAENESDSEDEGVQHALSVDIHAHNQWILDSGATCHMCNTEAMFSEVQAVTLGDGRTLEGTGPC